MKTILLSLLWTFSSIVSAQTIKDIARANIGYSEGQSNKGICGLSIEDDQYGLRFGFFRTLSSGRVRFSNEAIESGTNFGRWEIDAGVIYYEYRDEIDPKNDSVAEFYYDQSSLKIDSIWYPEENTFCELP